jgi:uncharacterized protein YbjT (DUF2867 family)
MKLVIFGGSGLIGTKLVKNLRGGSHEVIAASTRSGVNAVTGEGLAQALTGAQVVVDVMNSPDWEDAAVMKFFETSTRNLLAAGKTAGVRHHVALSVVGTDRLQESGFFRAKLVQEKQIIASGAPYTVIRATQFFEFIGAIVQAGAKGQMVTLPPALMQPMSGDDVAAAMADYAVAPALNKTVEIAGPEAFGIDAAARKFLTATGDARQVVSDAKAPYYGVKVSERSLMPDHADRLGPTRLADWLAHHAKSGAVAV